MAASTIDRVREAELNASRMQDEAEQKAEEIIYDAESRADQIITDARNSAVQLDSAVCAEAKIRADAAIRERGEQALRKAEELTAKTLKSKQNLINKLIEETLV